MAGQQAGASTEPCVEASVNAAPGEQDGQSRTEPHSAPTSDDGDAETDQRELGTGAGFTVKEVISHASAATDRKVPFRTGPRRPGDAASLVSGSQRALDELGWQPRRSSLKLMIGDAWRWHLTGGYSG